MIVYKVFDKVYKVFDKGYSGVSLILPLKLRRFCNCMSVKLIQIRNWNFPTEKNHLVIT